MDGYGLTALGLSGIGCLIAIGLAVQFEGGVVSAPPKHLRRSQWISRGVALLTCAYPLVWARGANYDFPVIGTALFCWGAVVGLIFYVIGLWYRDVTRTPPGPTHKRYVRKNKYSSH